MKVSFTLQYNRKDKLNKQGKAPVEIRAYHLGKNKYISTKIFVEPLYWNNKKREINSKHYQYVSLNMQLRKLLSDFETIQTKYIVNNKPFTLDTLSSLTSTIDKSFTEFCQSEKNSNIKAKPGTLMTHQNSLNKLKQLKDNILFGDLNFDLIQRFDYMLRSEGYAVNTIDKHHKIVIVYINLAINKGYMETRDNPYRQFKRVRENTNKQALTLAEVQSMENLTINPDEQFLHKIRDMFLFACYTGLRISDILRIGPKNVYKSEDGWVIENIKSKKSNKDIFIPLDKLFPNVNGVSKPVAIVEKYHNVNRESLFSKLSEPYINRRLKEIAFLANIDKNVTFHMARNTFATTMAQKISTPVLQQLLQHSDIKTTMIYVKISKQMIKDGVSKVIWN